MHYTFELHSCEWDTRSSFHEHQNERPEEQQRLNNEYVGIHLEVQEGYAESIDNALWALIDIINDKTGSMFHKATVRLVRGSKKEGERVSGVAIQDLGKLYERFPAKKELALEYCPTFIFDRKQELSLACD